MLLRLTVVSPSGDQDDVEVEASPDVSVGEVVAALARHAGLDADRTWRAHSWRKGRYLVTDAPLAGSGLATGDVLALDDEDGANADFAIEVIAGQAAGQVLTLGVGSHVLGQSRQRADLVVGDDSVSRAHLRVDVDGTGVRVEDLRSTNGTIRNGERLTGEVSWAPGEQLRLGDCVIGLVPPSRAGAGVASVTRALDSTGAVAFNRPPRLLPRESDEPIRLGPAPDEPAPRRLPLGTALLPLVLGGALAIALNALTMLAFAVLSPIMALYSWWDDRRTGRKAHVEAAREFREDLATAAAALRDRRAEERQGLLATFPGPDAIARRAAERSADLWDRRVGDADFAELRVGLGQQESRHVVDVPARGSAKLRAEAAATLASEEPLDDVPITLRLRQVGTVGVSGTRNHELAAWLAAQAAVLHSPRDLVIAVAVSADHADRWAWVRWLPHADRDDIDAGGPLLAVGDTAAESLAARLTSLLARRTGSKSRTRSDDPVVLLVWDRDLAGEPPTVDVEAGELLTIWTAARREQLPGGCRAVIETEGGTVRVSSSGEQSRTATADSLSTEECDRIARALAPVRDVSQRSGARIPNVVGLLDVLPDDANTAEGVLRRWRSPSADVAAPVGLTDSGPFSVDVRRDGPHALVCGVTRSGKSELLQSFVMSLAVHHSPQRVSFLLVDYKGASNFGPLSGLPHVVGLVTDLTPALASRALAALNAEIPRREHLLAEAGHKDITAMELAEPDNAPANLLVVVDELKALQTDVPAFVPGLIDLAARGASLGIHLVLGTQNPRHVGEDILANVDLRVALRLVEQDLSQRILGVLDAAYIPAAARGRAVARRNTLDVVTFQTAWGGRRRGSGGGPRLVVRRPGEKAAKTEGSGPTDLDQVMTAVLEAGRRHEVPLPPRPWLPALPDTLDLADLPAPDDDGRPFVGLLDLPNAQRQEPWCLPVEGSSCVGVFGAPRSGKTTTLRTIAAGVAGAATPAEAQIWLLDFAGGALSGLTALPHVAASAGLDDMEHVERMVLALRRIVDEQSAAFAAVGASSLAEFRRATGDRTTHPRIVVLVDGLAAFAAAHGQAGRTATLWEPFVRLVGDAAGTGVTFVVTSDQTRGLAMGLQASMTQRLALRLNSADDYAVLGLPWGRDWDPASLPAGRARLITGDELQVAVLGGDAGGPAQLAAFADLGARRRAEGVQARPLPRLPSRLPAGGLGRPDRPWTALVGVREFDEAVVDIDIAQHHLFVAGGRRSGRTTALQQIATSLAAGPHPAELRLYAPRPSPLTALPIWAKAFAGDEAADGLGELAQQLEQRSTSASPDLVVVIDDLDDLELRGQVAETIARRSFDRGVRIVAAGEPRGAMSGIARELRKHHVLWLQPDVAAEGHLFNVDVRRAFLSYPPGRGLLVQDGAAQVVQVAVPDPT